MARELSVAFEIMDRPWEWGVADCCTAACDVFEALHGIDPMAELRGAYDSKMGAAKEIAKRGGFIKMCEDLAFGAKLEESEGNPGDIGVADLGEGNLALVVCVDKNTWAGKTDRGLSTVHEVIRSWSCHR